ncbi:hypothetical protein [Gemmatimonas groenlandica]|uniref:Uncharacterized protein n=1 Tax=Gemmatimonas groenlandica TaxID=2732249 RepID=A0A6M4IR67_9BACT|nr:hypothetical protein [Gemmatimonas groenlandica]QJR37220.1 hypothetical protein HKW67_17700 [Gemmatimonas groenlandica]
MPIWLKRVRATLGMGVLWAVGGIGVGGLIELLDNVLPGGLAMASKVDMWPQTLAIPGFIGGVIFAVVLMIAARRQRFDELSLPTFAAMGAVAGLALGAIAMAIGAPVMFLGIMTVAGTAAATGSLLLARGPGAYLRKRFGRRDHTRLEP